MNEERIRKHYDCLWSSVSGSVLRRDEERASIVISLLPHDTESVLEVGCGEGLIINRVDWIPAMGLDISEQALKSVRHPAVVASVSRIPFPERYWDAVIASEVLEHIPEQDYQCALSEIQRVAERYIIISVPNEENLEKNMTLCPSCAGKFNAFHHVHSYSPRKMETLFPAFALKRLVKAGEPIRTPSSVELFIRHNILRRYLPFENTTCPMCGYSSFSEEVLSSKSPSGSWFVRMMRNFVVRLPVINRYRERWIFAVFAREEKQSVVNEIGGEYE